MAVYLEYRPPHFVPTRNKNGMCAEHEGPIEGDTKSLVELHGEDRVPDDILNACKDPNQEGTCGVHDMSGFPTVRDGETNLLYLPKCPRQNSVTLPSMGVPLAIAPALQVDKTRQPILLWVVVPLLLPILFLLLRRLFSILYKNNRSNSVLLSDGSTKVGRLVIKKEVLGYGSGGTVVYEGELDGRRVAVKKMLKQFVEMARQEIAALIDSDEHPNVVRCFAMEEDEEFVYLALERCEITLAVALDNTKERKWTDERFTRPDPKGKPIPTGYAYRLARDIAEGVYAVHSRGIVHRDLKPQNVLLTAQGKAKLSDMGLSKRVANHHASFKQLVQGVVQVGRPLNNSSYAVVARLGRRPL